MKENNNYIYESNDDIDKNLNIDKAINQQNYLSNLNQDQSPENKKHYQKNYIIIYLIELILIDMISIKK